MRVFVLIAALLGVCATAQTAPARGKFGVFPDKNVAFPWTLLREGLIDDSFTNFAVAFADADGASEGFEVAGPFPYKYDYGNAKDRGRSATSSIALSDGRGFDGGAHAEAGGAGFAASRSWDPKAPRFSYLRLP